MRYRFAHASSVDSAGSTNLVRSSLVLVAVAAALSAGIAVSAQEGHGRPISIEERARGAERVVVGTILRSEAVQQVNQYGDQLIVSHTAVRVDETMKGAPLATVVVDVEGGSLNGVTMRASDMPTLEAGNRAVFFLKRSGPNSDTYVPHLRGYGILKLEKTNLVEHSSLSVDQIRTMVRGGVGR
jgi:hypothetical protein